MAEEHDVVIVGGGIAGLATALALMRVGINSLVLERAPEMRTSGAALTLFPNAWRALDALGVAQKLDAVCRHFQSGRVTNLDSGVTRDVSYTGTSTRDGLRALHRKALLEALVEELPTGTIRFSSKLAAVKSQVSNDSSPATLLELEDGSLIRAKVLIGCDGVHSVVAQWLGLSAPRDSGRASVRGLAVFPQGHGLRDEVRMFLGQDQRAGFAPLNDIGIYWFSTHAAVSEKEVMRGDPAAMRDVVIGNLAKDFPEEYLDVVRNADLSTISWAPLMYRFPWDVLFGPLQKGTVTVAGDAFHPMTPDLGQGGGAALEDAVVLARCLAPAMSAGYGGIDAKRAEKGIEEYLNQRKWRAAGLIAGAYLSGWVQQGGRAGPFGWAVKLFRDNVFYKFMQPKIMEAIQYDCGDLPSAA